MGNQSSGKLLHIEPQQFDMLVRSLEAKTPPKTQTAFSVKQIVGRLYGFIERSLAGHYSFDELAVMIRTSLAELETGEAVPEIKGATLRQYFLELKREREGQAGAAGRSGGRKKTARRSVKPPIDAGIEDAPETVVAIPQRAPTPKSSTIELAY
jgi:hypothetical protein